MLMNGQPPRTKASLRGCHPLVDHAAITIRARTELARLVADAADARLVVLEPHDHLHISHKRTCPRLLRGQMSTA